MMRLPPAPRTTLLTIVALVGLTTAACGGDETAAPTTTSSSATSPTAPARAECVAPTYTVDYPAGWSVNEPSDAAPCSWFHPDPFELPQDTEVIGIVVRLRYEAVDYSRLTDPESRAEDVLEVRETEVDGKPAVRMHTRSRGEGLLDAGVEIVSWYVDTGSPTLSATTTAASEGSFDANVATLDEMMESLRFTAEPSS